MKINQKGFTLIELLIVTAILAVLSTAAVFILNPAEIIKQTRDSQRLSDLNTTVSTLSLFNVDSTSTGGLGMANKLYISLPDTSSTCASITGLPPLAGGASYNCVTQENSRNVNNSGWIPVNFTSMSISSPFSVLPIDPVNAVPNYYKYFTNTTQFELATPLESQKYQPYMLNDGGDSDADYETGKSLTLIPGFSNLPTVTSPTVTSVTTSGATLGANVTSDGGATLTARGTCWGTTAGPVTNCLADGGTATGIFTHVRSGMSAGTLIYYRGYATNNAGTAYSADGTFTTGALPPTVISPTATSITSSSATLGANVTSDGGATLTARGTCWGITAAPLTNCNPEGTTTTGIFTMSAAGMSPNTLIYYRGYATNSAGTTYSPDGTFTTLAVVPILTSPTATSVTSTTATLGANVTSDGGATLTARGTCWATTANPTTNCLAEGLTTTGIFTHIRSGMSSGTLIYYRGYATNSIGTGYSPDGSFTTIATAPVNYLVVAGGGGGGAGYSVGSGGGGAGGMLTGSTSVIPQAYSIVVGDGGNGGTGPDSSSGTWAVNGNNSSVLGQIAIGGGRGGAWNTWHGSGVAGGNGGSGGGGQGPPGSGTSGQGNNGGTGNGSGVGTFGGGGGGGASTSGGNAYLNGCCYYSGNGGAGSVSSISGVSVTYAGGGGGEGNGTGFGGAGGGGTSSGTTGGAGAANTGGGAGAGATAGGKGGSGIVIISYPTGSLTATGGTITTSGGNTIHTFTTIGTSAFTVVSIP